MQPVGHPRGLLEALDAGDRLLDPLVKILHAQARTRYAGIRHNRYEIALERERLDLDDNLAVGGECDNGTQRFRDTLKIRGRQHCRGTPTPMNVDCAVPAAQLPSNQGDLAFEEADIDSDRSVAAGHPGVTAAIEAELGAARNVQIDRQRLAGRSAARQDS
jgi:hypothetical protein